MSSRNWSVSTPAYAIFTSLGWENRWPCSRLESVWTRCPIKAWKYKERFQVWPIIHWLLHLGWLFTKEIYALQTSGLELTWAPKFKSTDTAYGQCEGDNVYFRRIGKAFSCVFSCSNDDFSSIPSTKMNIKYCHSCSIHCSTLDSFWTCFSDDLPFWWVTIFFH